MWGGLLAETWGGQMLESAGPSGLLSFARMGGGSCGRQLGNSGEILRISETRARGQILPSGRCRGLPPVAGPSDRLRGAPDQEAGYTSPKTGSSGSIWKAGPDGVAHQAGGWWALAPLLLRGAFRIGLGASALQKTPRCISD